MGSVPTSALKSRPSGPTEAPYHEDFGPVDASVRAPVIALLGWAAVWLLVGLVLALVAAWKLHTPSFLTGCEFLTYGRIEPAATNTLLYGWGFNAALALGFWLLGRLAGSPLKPNRVGLIAIWFWNFAVAGGLVGILIGDATTLTSLEFPGYVTPVLLISFAVIGVSLVATLGGRRFESIYISQWYVIGAVFWFAWLYTAAQLMLVFFPVRGTVQAIVNAWFSHGLYTLWFGSIALAALYYFLPKISGRPVRHFYLASLGFWSYAAINAWEGVVDLVGAPVPAWVQTVGIAATLLSLVPIVVVSLNVVGTAVAVMGTVKNSPVLRFMTFAALAFLASSLIFVFSSFGSGAAATRLTYAVQGNTALGFYGFFSMAAFGAIYYLVPRMARRTWSSASLINVHFVASAVGILIIFAALFFGGLKQSGDLNNFDLRFAHFTDVVSGLLPFLFWRTVGVGLLLIGQIAFVVNLVFTFAPSRNDENTVVALPDAPEMEVIP